MENNKSKFLGSGNTQMSENIADFTLKSMPFPFANKGDKNDIPVSNNSRSGEASFDKGFPIETSLVDGVPPDRKDFNGIFYDLSNNISYLQRGGIYTFDKTVSDAIGGYAKNAILGYIDNGKLYKLISLIDNNTFNFNDDSSYIGPYWGYADNGTNILPDLSNVDSNIDFVIDSWSDTEGNWYRKYRSGWVEQGGVLRAITNNTVVITTLFIEMNDTNYNGSMVFADTAVWKGTFEASRLSMYDRTTTSFKTNTSTDIGLRVVAWKVEGQSAKNPSIWGVTIYWSDKDNKKFYAVPQAGKMTATLWVRTASTYYVQILRNDTDIIYQHGPTSAFESGPHYAYPEFYVETGDEISIVVHGATAGGYLTSYTPIIVETEGE